MHRNVDASTDSGKKSKEQRTFSGVLSTSNTFGSLFFKKTLAFASVFFMKHSENEEAFWLHNRKKHFA